MRHLLHLISTPIFIKSFNPDPLTVCIIILRSTRECPDELREAISSLVFADSRCGQLPELHEVRLILASRLGKEFIASAVELRNSCGVNTTVR